MPAKSSFDYAVVRVVPRVERGEFINAGVILHCATHDWLAARIELDESRLLALAPDVDLEAVRRHLAAIPRVCEGGPGAGPIGLLSQKERFSWLVATRSTMIQTSDVHVGLCDAPDVVLDRLLDKLVRVPRSR
ncbi:DUF3037 domain-containing protein [Polyangium sp. 6x1]|uniref:DUF3037 domain-containing protein n=1 Tax=Polyangium sp. 6x1 TaxID=3042689 RepID=UPI002482FBBB|nr:DUF3037 domain-containing protein [Polyangium sp. 6x1]MDI1447506.1 DUF3037 domain-containing protein [Polyangium sp. 6x1]